MKIILTNNQIKKASQTNLILFSLGQIVSLLGTFMFQFAAGLYVLNLTGSGMQFAITLIVGTIPRVVLSPFAGVVADRMNRKTIVVLTDLLSGIAVLGLLVISVTKTISVEGIYVTMVILTTCNTFFDVAMESAKPGIVKTSQLERLNAISTGIISLTSILGPILGGVAYGLMSFKFFVLINGISFLVSGISEIFINFHLNGELAGGKHKKQTEELSNIKSDQRKSSDFFADLSGGITYLKKNTFILSLMLFSLTVNFCLTLAITVPMPYLFNTLLKLEPVWVGIVSSGFPIGYLIGAGIISVKPVKRSVLALQAGVWGIWFGMFMLSCTLLLSQNLEGKVIAIIFTILLATIGLAIAYLDIPIMTIFQKVIPSEVRGRVMSLSFMMSRLAMPIAMITAGQMLSKVHPVWLMIAGTTLYFVKIIFFIRGAVIKQYATIVADQDSHDRESVHI